MLGLDGEGSAIMDSSKGSCREVYLIELNVKEARSES